MEVKGIIEVKIGKQVWMKNNLSVTSFRNGDTIPFATTKEEWENAGIEGQPACCYYNNDPENGKELGILYNSFAILDTRGLAPIGWRLPFSEDLEVLINHLGGDKIAGKKMKSTQGWIDSPLGKSVTNESGFSAYPSGNRDFIGKFQNKGLSCWWFCAKNNNNESNWFYYLDHEKDTINKGFFDVEDGLSVRCIVE